MPFYKRENDELMVAPNFVLGPGFELRAETHDEHTYPVEGWYWFDNLDAAMAGLLRQPSIGIVTMRQARLALLGAGLLPQVNAAIAAMPGVEGDAARIEWEYAQEVRRDSPIVAGLSAALNLSASDLDTLFAEAAKL